MLSREQFNEAINSVREYYEVTKEIDAVYRKHDIDYSYSPDSAEGKLLDAFVRCIEAGVEDPEEYVSWWLYETNKGLYSSTYGVDPIVIIDGENKSIDTSDDLYDLIIYLTGTDSRGE